VSAYKKLRARVFLSVGERRRRREVGPLQLSGLNPSLMFQVEAGQTVIHRHGRQETLDPGLDPLSTCAACCRVHPGGTRGCPGSGRAGGYLAMTWCATSSGCRPSIPRRHAEARLMLADNLLIFDNLRQTIRS